MRTSLTGLIGGVLLIGILSRPVDAQINVWGDLDLRGYFTGERVAPNGRPYDPLFSLRADLNVGWRDTFYLFSNSIFWGQKATADTTHGKFDFSKREFDLRIGGAWRPYPNWEARGFFYSLNNLNRGNDTEKPSGFDDGGALGGRYYWGPRNYVGAGYYVSKDLVDQKGQQFEPGVFAELGWYYDFWRKPEQAFVYVEAEFIAERPVTAKLLNNHAGVGIRPFSRFLNFELRLGVESVYDFQANKGRVLPYGGLGIRF